MDSNFNFVDFALLGLNHEDQSSSPAPPPLVPSVLSIHPPCFLTTLLSFFLMIHFSTTPLLNIPHLKYSMRELLLLIRNSLLYVIFIFPLSPHHSPFLLLLQTLPCQPFYPIISHLIFSLLAQLPSAHLTGQICALTHLLFSDHHHFNTIPRHPSSHRVISVLTHPTLLVHP